MPSPSRHQRGHYATNACTNCRKKHTKCSEETTCTYCSSHNLECIYVNPIKKRGPKTANRSAKVLNIEQKRSLALNEHQFSSSIPFYLNYNYNEGFQPLQTIQPSFFPYIDTNYFILNDNAPVNFSNIFSLPNNLLPSS
ncbi:23786_t:CDS:1 [Dentiscutata erythropus]|uniref:23786_t:CDS:1 n=1 Tax=Dentiscutata erythropus TaxID=1348616 RepID=A0A9N9D5R9_9GLOM|nr:23786_t:CDS:1 [Dentiscutata erythropus]